MPSSSSAGGYRHRGDAPHVPPSWRRHTRVPDAPAARMVEGIEAAAGAIARAEPPVEVLVNNAGGGRPYRLEAPLGAEAWDEAIGLNFTAARRLAESALPAMRRAGWGRIITITGSLALKRM